MSKYVALLRGINVSGQKIIKMDELKKLFESIGYTNVQTYIQSGNVVFKSRASSAEVFEKEIKAKIKKKFGFDVAVIVKDKKQIEEIMNANPFKNEKDGSKKYVTLLSSIPEKEKAVELSKFDNGIDTFTIKGNVIYTVYPNGMGKSDFNNNFIEKKLNMSATTRNWNTMNKLKEMMTE